MPSGSVSRFPWTTWELFWFSSEMSFEITAFVLNEFAICSGPWIDEDLLGGSCSTVIFP